MITTILVALVAQFSSNNSNNNNNISIDKNCYSYRACSYNQYIKQQISLIEHNL